jgi:hypothetical protein
VIFGITLVNRKPAAASQPGAKPETT